MKFNEAIAMLQVIKDNADDLMNWLSRTQDKSPQASSPAAVTCPIHKVKWMTFTWGRGHPPQEEGGKWCREKKPRKS